MTCKTREDAKAGKRDKPHYYLPNQTDRLFEQAKHVYGHLDAIEAFESRIDWSTWGRSR